MPVRTINGAAIVYGEAGQGTPVVLLHGFPLDSRIWKRQQEALQRGWRVITPDLRGFGESSANKEPFTIESLADDVHALLAEIGASHCVLGGLSMGGYVALAYANKYGNELRALVLIDTKSQADTPEGKEQRTRMVEVARQKGSPAVAELMMPKMLAADAAIHRPALAADLRTIMESCPPLTIEHALLAMRERPDRTGELPALKVPTLVLVGESDAITPPAGAEEMARAIPNTALAVIKGAGHMAPMEQPEQVNQAIERFLQTLGA
jgi:pimeloyl-ACP methyl ester carboxylesterase